MQRPDPRSAKNTNPSAEAGILAPHGAGVDRLDRAVGARRVRFRAPRHPDRDRRRRRADATSGLPQVVDAWGRGFWELIPFTLQMALVIITGHVLATSPPMGRVIRRVASWPTTPRGAVALVTFFALASSWINWGFSLVFSAVLAIEVARRVEGVDYRALAAASVLGLGSIWAQGLSGSAALQMATPGALQPQIRDIVATAASMPGGVIPFRHTIFLWQSLVAVAIEIASSRP